MESVEKLTELHEIQFGSDQIKDVETKIAQMKSLVGEINKIKLKSMDSKDVENRVQNLLKQIDAIRRSAEKERFSRIIMFCY